jgi:hypothetical protein
LATPTETLAPISAATTLAALKITPRSPAKLAAAAFTGKRGTFAGKLPTFWCAAAAWACWPAWSRTTGRPAKPTTVAPIRCTANLTPRPVVATLAAAPLIWGRFILHPRGAEAEAAQLAQIDFIQVCGRGFLLGSVVVHGVEKRAINPRG